MRGGMFDFLRSVVSKFDSAVRESLRTYFAKHDFKLQLGSLCTGLGTAEMVAEVSAGMDCNDARAPCLIKVYVIVVYYVIGMLECPRTQRS
jgi:hypothetical protein